MPSLGHLCAGSRAGPSCHAEACTGEAVVEDSGETQGCSVAGALKPTGTSVPAGVWILRGISPSTESWQRDAHSGKVAPAVTRSHPVAGTGWGLLGNASCEWTLNFLG